MDRLKIFYTVAQYRSFTKAAEVLGLTQPAISFQIKALENEYCTELFERIGRDIFITDSGKTLMIYAEKILSALEEADLALKESNNPLKGRVNFGASIVAGIYILPRILGNFKRRYPNVALSMKMKYASARDIIVGDIARNEIDFGIMVEDNQAQNEKDLLSIPLLKDELVFVMSPRHKFANRKILPVNEILSENLILGARNSATRNYIDSEFSKLGFHITPYLELENLEVIKRMVEEDFGSGILSWASVRSNVMNKELCARRLEGVKLIRNISLVKRQQKTFFPATNLFIDFLKDAIELTAKSFIFEQ